MATQAGTLSCPSCGAPADAQAHVCDYCGTPLATTACPSCFGMVFRGSEFCSHCGARVQLAQQTGEGEPCPRCGVPMVHKRLGDTQVSECSGCGGLWVDAQSFERICADSQRQALVIAHELPPPMPPGAHKGDQRFYMHCPICNRMMNRTNFASYSGVVIDICTQHGIWFDRDELRRVIEFIRAGGMDKSREKELEKLDIERSRIERLQSGDAAVGNISPFACSEHDETVDLVRVVGGLLRFFMH